MRKQRYALVETNITGSSRLRCSGTIYEKPVLALRILLRIDVNATKLRTAGDDAGKARVSDGRQGRLPMHQGHLYVITGNGDFGWRQPVGRIVSQAAIFAAKSARPQR